MMRQAEVDEDNLENPKLSIQRSVTVSGGRKRVSFLVSENGSDIVLRSRGDVVLFLSKRKELNLSVDDFSFKQKNNGLENYYFPSNAKISKENVDHCEAMEIESGPITPEFDIDEVKDEESFEFKLQRITGCNLVDHNEKYEKVLDKLHTMRSKISREIAPFSAEAVSQLKSLITDVNVDSDPVCLAKEILKNEEVAIAIKRTLQTQVEAEVELASMKNVSSSMVFPVDVNSNIYCDIIEEAYMKLPNLLEFVVNMIDSDQDILTPNYAIRCANLLVNIMSCKDKRHSAIQKINTLHMMFQKSTVLNLKTFGQKGFSSGYSEATRLIEEMSELAEYFKSSQYNLGLGMQITADNVDCVMKGNLEHWILAYSRKDPVNPRMISDEIPTFDVKQATHSVVYLVDEEIEYLKRCCKIVLSKKISDMKIGFSNILKFVPYEPIHDFPEMLEKQDIFFESLEPLHEMEHQGIQYM